MNINKFNNGGSHFPPMDAGSHAAVCVGVIDIGTHTETWEGKSFTKDQVILLFDFPTETIEIEGEQKIPSALLIVWQVLQHWQTPLYRI